MGMIIGMDIGIHSGIVGVTPKMIVRFKTIFDLKSSQGTHRLDQLYRTITKVISQNQTLINAEGGVELVAIEEPPLVRNIRSYAVLSQFFAVSSLALYHATGVLPMGLKVPDWKKAIGATVTPPTELRGKANQKEREHYMKTAVIHALQRQLPDAQFNKLRGGSWEMQDATGIALAALLLTSKIRGSELTKG